MKKIHVARGFTLTMPDTSKKEFAPGFHEVDDDIAEHWYVKLHLGDIAESAAPSESLSDAERKELEQLRADKAARDKAEAEAKEKAAADVKAKAEAEAKAKAGK